MVSKQFDVLISTMFKWHTLDIDLLEHLLIFQLLNDSHFKVLLSFEDSALLLPLYIMQFF